MQRAVVLEPYQAIWPADDPNADFRSKVAEYSRLDPLPTLENLSCSTGIPVGSLARFVLVRYCTSGSDALLEMGPRVVRQMDEIIQQAEATNTDAARLDAASWRALKARAAGAGLTPTAFVAVANQPSFAGHGALRSGSRGRPGIRRAGGAPRAIAGRGAGRREIGASVAVGGQSIWCVDVTPVVAVVVRTISIAVSRP